MGIAFFDMDGTIVGGDTNDISIGEFVKLNLAPKSIIDKLNRYEEAFYEGKLDINEFVKFACTPLLNLNKDELYNTLHKVVRDSIIPVVFKGAKERIKFHNDRGDTIVIVTSTMDYLVEHVAEQLNIKYFIAAPMEKVNGVITGRQCGLVPYQKDKVVRIKEFIKEHNLSLEETYGYGDSINDIPMLEMCEHRFAVNPNANLLEHPFIKECQIVDWSKQRLFYLLINLIQFG